jgi:acetyl-CoA carboxylase biotin carboxyl carrier protein
MARERSGEPTRPQPRQADHTLSIAELRQLIALMQHSDIEEITIERDADGVRLRLRKPALATTATTSGTFEAESLETLEPTAALETAGGPDHRIHVSAQLVGRFHVGSRPGAKALVAVGDIVRPGQVVGTIETLNVLNEVEVSHPGRVVEIVAREGQAVEYGQLLMALDPLPA